MQPAWIRYTHLAFLFLTALWLGACTVSPRLPDSATVEDPEAQSRTPSDFERERRPGINPASDALARAATALRLMQGYNTTFGVAMLQLLEDVPSGTLQQISQAGAGASGLEDWPELALLIRQTMINRDDLHASAAVWTAKHPRHDVSESIFVELAKRYRQLFSIPSQIAVLLPEEGGLATAGEAIRDGLISAFLNAPEDVSLRFYPTSEDPRSAVTAYFQAVADGAQWIIGPLRRESVQALLELGGLAVPALLLNTRASTRGVIEHKRMFWSLFLSQAQEARAIARKALEQDQMSAIVLTSNNAWGRRMEAEFSEEFIAGGGEIVASGEFEAVESDHSALLTRILQIDESQERKNRVQATLGIPLKFEPVRRDDFELVFLAANPVQGRQLRPQLRFHDAGIKPVYAMGRIYTGEESRTADQDLNGVIFPSTRWSLSRQVKTDSAELASLRNGSLGSLHALGMDAWNLLPWLPLMRKDSDLQFPGALGLLSTNQDGQVIRDPAWAQFVRGRPVPIVWITPQDLASD